MCFLLQYILNEEMIYIMHVSQSHLNMSNGAKAGGWFKWDWHVFI